MLVLSRMKDESVAIGVAGQTITLTGPIIITVVDIRSDKVRLGIQASNEIPVHRSEVYLAIQRENGQAETPSIFPARRNTRPAS